MFSIYMCQNFTTLVKSCSHAAPMSWPQFTLRPEDLVQVRQLNTKAFKLPFMSELLFLSKPCTCSLSSLDTESTDFIEKS